MAAAPKEIEAEMQAQNFERVPTPEGGLEVITQEDLNKVAEREVIHINQFRAMLNAEPPATQARGDEARDIALSKINQARAEILSTSSPDNSDLSRNRLADIAPEVKMSAQSEFSAESPQNALKLRIVKPLEATQPPITIKADSKIRDVVSPALGKEVAAQSERQGYMRITDEITPTRVTDEATYQRITDESPASFRRLNETTPTVKDISQQVKASSSEISYDHPQEVTIKKGGYERVDDENPYERVTDNKVYERVSDEPVTFRKINESPAVIQKSSELPQQKKPSEGTKAYAEQAWGTTPRIIEKNPYERVTDEPEFERVTDEPVFEKVTDEPAPMFRRFGKTYPEASPSATAPKAAAPEVAPIVSEEVKPIENLEVQFVPAAKEKPNNTTPGQEASPETDFESAELEAKIRCLEMVNEVYNHAEEPYTILKETLADHHLLTEVMEAKIEKRIAFLKEHRESGLDDIVENFSQLPNFEGEARTAELQRLESDTAEFKRKHYDYLYEHANKWALSIVEEMVEPEEEEAAPDNAVIVNQLIPATPDAAQEKIPSKEKTKEDLIMAKLERARKKYFDTTNAIRDLEVLGNEGFFANKKGGNIGKIEKAISWAEKGQAGFGKIESANVVSGPDGRPAGASTINIRKGSLFTFGMSRADIPATGPANATNKEQYLRNLAIAGLKPEVAMRVYEMRLAQLEFEKAQRDAAEGLNTELESEAQEYALETLQDSNSAYQKPRVEWDSKMIEKYNAEVLRYKKEEILKRVVIEPQEESMKQEFQKLPPVFQQKLASFLNNVSKRVFRGDKNNLDRTIAANATLENSYADEFFGNLSTREKKLIYSITGQNVTKIAEMFQNHQTKSQSRERSKVIMRLLNTPLS